MITRRIIPLGLVLLFLMGGTLAFTYAGAPVGALRDNVEAYVLDGPELDDDYDGVGFPNAGSASNGTTASDDSDDSNSANSNSATSDVNSDSDDNSDNNS